MFAVSHLPGHVRTPAMRKTVNRARPPQRNFPLARAMACGLALVTAVGCQGITANSPEAAQVRFVQASVDTPPVDMYFDTNGAAYNLSFGTVTSYVSLSPGIYRVSAHRGGTGQALVSGQAVLGASRQYTAVIGNTLSSLQETLFQDAGAPAPPGTVAVRIINEASSSGPIDVYLVAPGGTLATATPLVRELGFGTASAYEHVPADKTYAVVPVPSRSTPKRTASLENVTVSGASGAVRTVIISDTPPKSNKPFSALVLSDYDTP